MKNVYEKISFHGPEEERANNREEKEYILLKVLTPNFFLEMKSHDFFTSPSTSKLQLSSLKEKTCNNKCAERAFTIQFDRLLAEPQQTLFFLLFFSFEVHKKVLEIYNNPITIL